MIVDKENKQLQAILNSMVEGVIAVDKDTRVVSINPSVERIFGIAKEKSEGRLFLEMLRNNDIYEVIDSVLKKGEPLSKELNIVLPVQRVFKVNASPIFDERSISGCLVVLHDITEIRHLEKVRSDFVANISHELKTPLTSIKGFIETLLEGAIDDKANSRDFLNIIQKHVERLNYLINDLLELSYLESKEANLEVGEVSLRALVDGILRGFESRIKKRNMQIQNSVPERAMVRADKEKMEQVLINLIDNAVKFNRENGFIKIYCEDLDGKLKTIIEDSGSGIPEKDLSRIFERFYRVDKARSRQLGGTGLGLSIVKHIIELQGGSVGVESIEGLGSKFWFILPK